MNRVKRTVLCTALSAMAFCYLPPRYMSLARAENAAKNEAVTLSHQLDDPKTPENTKAQVCVQLQSMGGKAAPAVASLTRLLASHSAVLQIDAAHALMAIGPAAASAAPTLKALSTQSQDQGVRAAASDALVAVSAQPAAKPTAKPQQATPAQTAVAAVADAVHKKKKHTDPAASNPSSNDTVSKAQDILSGILNPGGQTASDSGAAGQPTANPIATDAGAPSAPVAGTTDNTAGQVGQPIAVATPIATDTGAIASVQTDQPIFVDPNATAAPIAPPQPNPLSNDPGAILASAQTTPSPVYIPQQISQQLPQQLPVNSDPALTTPTPMPQPTAPVSVTGSNAADAAWGDLNATPVQMNLHLASVPDPRVGAQQAFTMLVPDQWYGSGGMAWTEAYHASPAKPMFELRQPQAQYLIKTLPTGFYFWSKGAQANTQHDGAAVLQPPASCQDALARYAWPMAHGMQTAPAVSYTRLPDVAAAYQYLTALPGKGYKCGLDAGRVRVRFQQSGRDMDEDLFGVYCIITNQSTGESNWVLDQLIEYQAPAGQLDVMEKQAAFIPGSIKISAGWYSDYLQYQQYLINRSAAGANANTLQRPRPGTAGPLNTAQAAALKRFEAGFTYSAIGVDKDLNLKSLQSFKQADGSWQVFPAGYGHAWSDGAGHFVISNAATAAFPAATGVGTAPNWTALAPAVAKKP